MKKILDCVCGYKGEMPELQLFNKLGLHFPVVGTVNNESVILYVCPRCGTVKICGC